MKRKYVILLSILAVVVIGIFFAVEIVDRNLNKLADLQIPDVDLAQIPDGIYTGEYGVFPVSAEVRVTVADHTISGIELIKHRNGQGSAAEVIPDLVVKAQSLGVDAISGATYSSKVILKAIENALAATSPIY